MLREIVEGLKLTGREDVRRGWGWGWGGGGGLKGTGRSVEVSDDRRCQGIYIVFDLITY